ncbi:MAG TPA: hypothetical protein VFC78_12120 [Tepidisphaeraceae bacterium]|nr:hypothetical protein [Tepidisphaeraceae bacterium]
MDHKSAAIVVQKVDHLNHLAGAGAANYQPLLPIHFAREAAARIQYNALDISNGAAVLGRLFTIPLNPAELRWGHDKSI